MSQQLSDTNLETNQQLLEIRLMLCSPAHFGAGPLEGNVLRTLRHVPGPALRGALAFHYQEELPGPEGLDGDFFQWAFLSGRVRWPELRLPAGQFVPKSLRRCKENADHPPADEVWATERLSTCGVCGGPLERAVPVQPRTRLITRTAIEPSARTARDGTLHTIEVLEEAQTFTGVLQGEAADPYWPALADWLQEVRRFPPALGGGRSRGLGSVALGTGRAEQTPEMLPRLLAWNAGGIGMTRFAVTLSSPAILRDALWRFQRTLGENDLAASAPGLAGAVRDGSWADATPVGGWNGVARLPKSEALAIETGSVFTFTSPLTPEALAPALSHLEAAGIGERRAEGFGRVSVCHPGHVAYRDLAYRDGSYRDEETQS